MWPSNISAIARLGILGFGVALSSCSPARFVSNVRLQFDPADRVTFGPKDAERWIVETRRWICQDQSPCPQDDQYIYGNTGLPYQAESFWRPSRSEIRRFDQKLSLALGQARSEYHHDPPGALWQYSVQYIGYVRDGKRLIYAQGFLCGHADSCLDVSQNWRVVMDGGTSVFGASFDVETGKLLGLGFNGYA